MVCSAGCLESVRTHLPSRLFRGHASFCANGVTERFVRQAARTFEFPDYRAALAGGRAELERLHIPFIYWDLTLLLNIRTYTGAHTHVTRPRARPRGHIYAHAPLHLLLNVYAHAPARARRRPAEAHSGPRRGAAQTHRSRNTCRQALRADTRTDECGDILHKRQPALR